MILKQEPKSKFIQLAVKHYKEKEFGTISKANQICKRLRKICQNQCDNEDHGNAFFSELITHEEPAVRLWAATFLYLSDPVKAIAEFQSLKELQIPHVSISASSNLWFIERGMFQISFD